MKNLAENLLTKLDKMSMDDMDNFDKFDYYRDNIEDDIKFLCMQVLNDGPMIVSNLTSCDTSLTNKIEDSLLEEYNESEVIMGEMLSSIGVNNVSLEKAVELYASLMNEAEGDTFIQIYNDSIDEADLDELGDYRKL